MTDVRVHDNIVEARDAAHNFIFEVAQQNEDITVSDRDQAVHDLNDYSEAILDSVHVSCNELDLQSDTATRQLLQRAVVLLEEQVESAKQAQQLIDDATKHNMSFHYDAFICRTGATRYPVGLTQLDVADLAKLQCVEQRFWREIEYKGGGVWSLPLTERVMNMVEAGDVYELVHKVHDGFTIAVMVRPQ